MIVRYVNPDSDGGDGTTAALTGVNAAYQDLVTWEAAMDGDITGEAGGSKVICDSNGTADTGGKCYLNNWITDSDSPITVEVAAANRSADGTWDTSKYIQQVTADDAFYLREEFINLYGLQIEVVGPTASDQDMINIAGVTAGAVHNISHCIFKSHGSATYDNTGITASDVDATLYAWNNVLYGFNATPVDYGMSISAGTSYVYNNTVIGGRAGIRLGGSTCHAKNNVCQGANDDFLVASGSFAAASGRNITNTDPNTAADGGSCFGTAVDSGTTDGVATGKLIDVGQNFETTCKVGFVVKNTTDTTYTYITAIDDNENLSINDDIFTSGEGYEIYPNIVSTLTFGGGDDYDLAAGDSAALANGYDLDGDAARYYRNHPRYVNARYRRF
ncbi:MAG: hypothetical protein ACYTEQ_30195 [Planctomycetota bacterium]|jgi:hypothetical protein